MWGKSQFMKWLLKKYMAEQHIESMAELSDMTGIPRRTLYDRISEPQSIKLFELEALDKALHFADEDLLKVTRGKI